MKRLQRLVVLIVTIVAIDARSADLIADLTVSGERLAVPEWQDESSNIITSVTFDFGGIVDGNANVHVLSSVHQIRLVDGNDPGGPKSIRIVRPKDCTVGANAVTNSHVRIAVDGTWYTNTNVNMTEGVLYTVQMRFNAAGNYADKIGLVSCATAGRFSFEY